jgi:hypothetical protein
VLVLDVCGVVLALLEHTSVTPVVPRFEDVPVMIVIAPRLVLFDVSDDRFCRADIPILNELSGRPHLVHAVIVALARIVHKVSKRREVSQCHEDRFVAGKELCVLLHDHIVIRTLPFCFYGNRSGSNRRQWHCTLGRRFRLVRANMLDRSDAVLVHTGFRDQVIVHALRLATW